MDNEQTPVARSNKMPLRWRMLLCLLFFGPAVYFKVQGDYITGTVLSVAGIAAFSGYRAGAIYIFTLLAAITGSIALAPQLGASQELRFSEWFGTTGLTNRFLCVGAVGIVIAVTISTVVWMLSRRFVSQRPRLDAWNRWAGFGTGAVEGVAVVALFLGGMLVIEPLERERAEQRDPADARGRMLSKLILTTCDKTRSSLVGPLIVQCNPFEQIPQLNKLEEVQRSVEVLSDPAKIESLLHHPAVQELRQRPEVQQVVQRITSDPEIRDVLRSGGRMNGTMAMTLLSHPAVMELVDQPGFLETAGNVIYGN